MRKSRGIVGSIAAASAFRACLLVGLPSRAQDPELAFDQVVGHPRGLPQLPPQGAWGEVINVTSRWIVIQNHSGQQYPIAADDIGEFLVRWPTSLDALGPQSMVEAVGRDVGSNVVEVSHVDVFRGSRSSASSRRPTTAAPQQRRRHRRRPGVQSADERVGLRRPEHALRLGLSESGRVLRNSHSHPRRRHSHPAHSTPAELPGNNFATVVAGENLQFTMSQVTRGSIDIRPQGRLCLPDAAGNSIPRDWSSRSSCCTSRSRSANSTPHAR